MELWPPNCFYGFSPCKQKSIGRGMVSLLLHSWVHVMPISNKQGFFCYGSPLSSHNQELPGWGLPTVLCCGNCMKEDGF